MGTINGRLALFLEMAFTSVQCREGSVTSPGLKSVACTRAGECASRMKSEAAAGGRKTASDGETDHKRLHSRGQTGLLWDEG